MSYMSSLGADSPTSGDIKALQYEINKFIPGVIPTPIDEDGVLGSGTVAAAAHVAKSLSGSSLISPTFVVGAANKAFLASNVKAYTAAFYAAALVKGYSHHAPKVKTGPTSLPSTTVIDEDTLTMATSPGLLDMKVMGIPVIAIAGIGALVLFAKRKGKRRGKR